MARMVQCIKLGKEAEGLDFPPYPGELGKRLWENVSKEAWAAWLKQQTMLVNENRLNLADARARQYLARQMEKHFFGDGADVAQGYVPPTELSPELARWPSRSTGAPTACRAARASATSTTPKAARWPRRATCFWAAAVCLRPGPASRNGGFSKPASASASIF